MLSEYENWQENLFIPRLLQVEFDTQQVAPGETINLTYWWENLGRAPAREDFRIFVHPRLEGLPEDGTTYPMFGGDFDPSPPTSGWSPGGIFKVCSSLNIPQNARPGIYRLLVGMYSPTNGQRQPLQNPEQAQPDGRYMIGTFEVVEPWALRIRKKHAMSFFPLPSAGERSFIPLAERIQETVTLSDGAFSVDLHAEKPVILRIRGKGSGATLYGEVGNEEPRFLICNTTTGDKRWNITEPLSVRYTCTRSGEGQTVVYRTAVSWGKEEAVHFDLIIHFNHGRLIIGFDNVEESPGYQLLTVRLPGLVTALRSQPGARLVVPWEGGRIVDLTLCSGGSLREHRVGWSNAAPVGLIYRPKILAAVEIESPDDILRSSISDYGSDVAASLSADLTYRHQATRPDLQFVAQTHSEVSVRLLEASPGGSLTWVDGAKLLRQEVNAIPPKLYRDSVIYKIFCDSLGYENYTTFEEALNLVRQLYHLTDGLKQVVYLVGWQHRGHDTGYPDVFTVNQRLGGYEKLVEVMKEAEKYNAVISFHDNFDDAYKDSPAWNADVIARGPDGELMKGSIWAGGQTYILAPAWYLKHGALERIGRTLTMYPIRETYHIDVLSAVPDRLDFNPAHPAGATANLIGKLGIIEQFARQGVDVTSEVLTSWFVGHIGHAWHLSHRNTPAFVGDKAIPFIPFLYHGHVTYGGNVADDASFLSALLYGQTFSADFSKYTRLEDILDRIYLLNAPYLLLREREMERYEEDGMLRRVYYGPAPSDAEQVRTSEGQASKPTFVEVDDAAGLYQVVVDGRLVTRNFSTFMPCTWRDIDTWLAYSRYSGELVYPAPDGWDERSVVEAICLGPDGPEDEVPCFIAGGQIHIQVRGGVPVRVSRKAQT